MQSYSVASECGVPAYILEHYATGKNNDTGLPFCSIVLKDPQNGPFANTVTEVLIKDLKTVLVNENIKGVLGFFDFNAKKLNFLVGLHMKIAEMVIVKKSCAISLRDRQKIIK